MQNNKMTLQEANIARVKELVGEYQAGRPEGYLAGVSENMKGSVLGGLIPGGDNFTDKEGFAALMGKMGEYMEVSKFEPKNWRAVGDDVLFNVEWKFLWKGKGPMEGKEVETVALVRKVVKDNMICEKYHMVDVEAITGEKSPHGDAAVTRVQELLAEYGAGRPEGYLAGCAEDFKGSVLDGLIPGGVFTEKAGFAALMGKMGEYMEVSKFEPCNFRALPNNDMMFNVNWTFVWKETGKEVNTTAVVRKVLNENGDLCEKYHMIDVDAVLQASPREVITA